MNGKIVAAVIVGCLMGQMNFSDMIYIYDYHGERFDLDTANAQMFGNFLIIPRVRVNSSYMYPDLPPKAEAVFMYNGYTMKICEKDANLADGVTGYEASWPDMRVSTHFHYWGGGWNWNETIPSMLFAITPCDQPVTPTVPPQIDPRPSSMGEKAETALMFFAEIYDVKAHPLNCGFVFLVFINRPFNYFPTPPTGNFAQAFPMEVALITPEAVIGKTYGILYAVEGQYSLFTCYFTVFPSNGVPSVSMVFPRMPLDRTAVETCLTMDMDTVCRALGVFVGVAQ